MVGTAIVVGNILFVVDPVIPDAGGSPADPS